MQFGLIIESLVAVLLLLTIGYCVILNNRLKKLRADEQSLRAVISELITATEIAERAILGLKSTATEADRTLSSRLEQAETSSRALQGQLEAGENIVDRLSQITQAARAPKDDILRGQDMHHGQPAGYHAGHPAAQSGMTASRDLGNASGQVPMPQADGLMASLASVQMAENQAGAVASHAPPLDHPQGGHVPVGSASVTGQAPVSSRDSLLSELQRAQTQRDRRRGSAA